MTKDEIDVMWEKAIRDDWHLTMVGSDIRQLIGALLNETKRADEFYQKWHTATKQTISLKEKLEIISEREAACCPEDVAFDEQIKYLQFCIRELEEKLRAATGPGDEI